MYFFLFAIGFFLGYATCLIIVYKKLYTAIKFYETQGVPKKLLRML